MYEKCYDLNFLEKYRKNSFIHERKSINKENVYSYETIIHETKKCIEYLTKLHVKNQTGIAIDIKEHSAAACILLLAILNHDCHFYCMDFAETKDDETYLNASRVKYVISKQHFVADYIKQLSNDITILDNIFFLYILENNNRSTLENSRLCYTIATSGSTGIPKMVHVPFKCIEPNVKAFSKLLNIQQDDMIFLGAPPTFDPFVMELLMALENGAKILITSQEIRLSPQLLKIICPEPETLKQGATVYQTTPSLFRLFGQESIRDVIFNKQSSLRCLILGGEEFPCMLEFKSWLPIDFFSFGKRVFNVYGITEISCWSSIYEFDTTTLERTKISLGSPLDEHTYFRLVEDSSNVLSHKASKGELEIGSCMRRCFIPQQDNDVKILEGSDVIYRKTGDLVERDTLGNIYYIGRANNTVKRFGKRLSLDALNKKVKNILNDHQIFLTAYSLWLKESSKLIFCLYKSKETADEEKQIVVKILKESLQSHELPDNIFYDKQLPLNSHGKVDSKKILQQLSLSYKTPEIIFKDFLKNVMGFKFDAAENKPLVPPSTSKRLKLSTDLAFLQAGGTSFQALSLATEIAEFIGESFEQRKILEMLLDSDATIKDILAFLTSCSKNLKKLNKLERFPHKRLKNIKLQFKLNLVWQSDLKKCIDAAPSIFEGKYVSVGSHSHICLTVNALTGEVISRVLLKDRIECPVVFVNSQLAVVGCYDGLLYGLNFNNGNIVWHLNVNGLIKAKPLLVQKAILIASYAEDYNVLAFDIESLKLLWKLRLGTKGIFSSPVQVTEESVLFCCLDGTYALLEAQTGVIQWQQKLKTPIFSTAAKLQTRNEILLVLAEVKGLITICKAENGETITTFQANGNVFSGLTLLSIEPTNSSLIIFGCHDKNVYCLKLEHKTKKVCLFSKYALNAAVYSTPIVALNSCILACSTKGLIVLLDVLETKVLATTDLKADIFSTPNCLNDEYVYVCCRDNFLYCFRLEK